MKSKKHITVFEHQKLKIGQQDFDEKHRQALEVFYGEKGVPYYNLIHKGVQFSEYVGVLQVGELTIEVLPKADKYNETTKWRNILIGMLQAVGLFNIHAPSMSTLSIKTNFILDLYIELFLKEVEYLVRKGLVKKYRKQEKNSFALKGQLKFGKHLQQNLIHKERFYVQQTVYDNQHLIHQILYKTLRLLQHINNSIHLNSRIGSLLLDFPELNDLKVTEATFNTITYNRKTKPYKSALEISKLLLLNYHPDLSKGQNDVLALLFNMNLLWEQFVYVSLRKYLRHNLGQNARIKSQAKKSFWKPEKGRSSTMKPDIVIAANGENIVLDTKWKNIGNDKPKPDDLRQLFVYHEYFKAKKVALIYPGKQSIKNGQYYDYDMNNQGLSDKQCAIIKIETNENIGVWQQKIAEVILSWIKIINEV